MWYSSKKKKKFSNLKCETVSLYCLICISLGIFFIFIDQSGFFFDLFVCNCCPFFYWVVRFFIPRTRAPVLLKQIQRRQLNCSISCHCSLFSICFSFLLNDYFLSLSSEMKEGPPPCQLPPPPGCGEYQKPVRVQDAAPASPERQDSGPSKAISVFSAQLAALLMCSAFIEDESCCL